MAHGSTKLPKVKVESPKEIGVDPLPVLIVYSLLGHGRFDPTSIILSHVKVLTKFERRSI